MQQTCARAYEASGYRCVDSGVGHHAAKAADKVRNHAARSAKIGRCAADQGIFKISSAKQCYACRSKGQSCRSKAKTFNAKGPRAEERGQRDSGQYLADGAGYNIFDNIDYALDYIANCIAHAFEEIAH